MHLSPDIPTSPATSAFSLTPSFPLPISSTHSTTSSTPPPFPPSLTQHATSAPLHLSPPHFLSPLPSSPFLCSRTLEA
ncbi:hypothetical protein E2C01_040297 [Portunus trituberculatus]|uniref:Uncharacterized protein n=1 Tax=Portunus trituberculatus TaxID=210409 RepID=A0A5B7FM65_PORTR|nr:hypothetical protein [Portunus trituberculatus]